MRGRTRPFLAATALALAVTACAAAADRPDAAGIARLVARLGGDSYAEREAATKALDAAGGPALDALRVAAHSQDPEVRRRAAALVRAIEQRAETARLLEPRKLRLQYKDAPLAEALADFTKKTGVALKLLPETKADRKVTLDTGEVTFWEALDKLCDKAGLVEAAPPAPAPNPAGNSITISGAVIRGGRVAPTDVLKTAPDDKPVELTLGDGKPAPVPTLYAGAVRVRLAPADLPVPNHKKEGGEALFALDVAADGRVQWQKAVGLRVTRALDEDGRPLSQLPTSFKPPTSAAAGRRSSVIINGVPISPPEDEPMGLAARLVAVRLKQPEKPAKKLKELTGTVTGQVRTAPQELVTVGEILKAAGKTVKGGQGGEVRVVSVTKEDDGSVVLKVQVEAAGRGADALALPINGTIIINGKRLGEDDNLLSSLNFALRDDKGKPFRTVKAVSTGLRAGAAHEYELTYRPEAGQGAAAKFVYTDRRTLLIDVPFTLKDVPLP